VDTTGRHARWLRFNDDRVTPVTDREVVDENYSGEPSKVVPHAQSNRALVMERSTNANVLVYIRNTAADELTALLTKEDTPPHLVS